MNHLHPFTVRSQDETPSTQDLIGDTNVVTRGVFEDAVAAQAEAESHYAALCCDAEPDARELAVSTTILDLLKLRDQHGDQAMYDAIESAMDQAVVLEQAKIQHAFKGFGEALAIALA